MQHLEHKYTDVLTFLSDANKVHYSQGAKYFFEDLLHLLVTKLFSHLKETTLHQQCENQCWTSQFLVASEI